MKSYAFDINGLRKLKFLRLCNFQTTSSLLENINYLEYLFLTLIDTLIFGYCGNWIKEQVCEQVLHSLLAAKRKFHHCRVFALVTLCYVAPGIYVAVRSDVMF